MSQKKFIKFPTKWDVTPDEVTENAEKFGIDYEPVIKEGFIYVDPDHISAINDSSLDGCSTIRFGDNVYTLTISLDELISRLNIFYDSPVIME